MRRLPEMSYTSVRQDTGGVKMVVKLFAGIAMLMVSVPNGTVTCTLVNTTVAPPVIVVVAAGIPPAVGICME